MSQESEFDLARVTGQILHARSLLETQSEISSNKLFELRSYFGKPQSKVVEGFEIPDMPEAVQSLLGSPKSKYRIEIKIEGKKTGYLSIKNQGQKTEGLELVFFLNPGEAPFSYHFPQLDSQNGPFGYLLKSEVHYRKILAEKILSKAAECFA